MAKSKTHFICQNCGMMHASWLGKCSGCNEWGTLVEELIQEAKTLSRELPAGAAEPIPISEVKYEDYDRLSSGFKELDLVLGGGIVDGALTLVGGDPGIGKSTLLLQLASNVSKQRKVLYASGEESLSQIKLRAERIGIGDSNISLLAENEINRVLHTVKKEGYEVLIVDSIQTMFDENISSAQGSVSQVREITSRLMRLAKSENIVVFIIGHVTKSGSIAGPKVLEHMVDTVLYFEGEKNNLYKIIRAVKNRFGSTNELGIFEMKQNGLVGVANPSEIFISHRTENEAGSVITASVEGSRPLLIEVQALCSVTSFPSPRRIALGMDYNRLNILLAVMEKKLGINMNSFDVYVNLVGGVTVNEPAIDLAVISAIISSYRNKPVKQDLLLFGELGLAGEIRPVSNTEKRMKEAVNLGFKTLIVPKSAAKEAYRFGQDCEILYVDKLYELTDLLF
ncbi:MAG: DNA repair protein RadA [Bacillota bacterium]|nr:DNA repair protein RadA [Bacillota bacterium]